MEPHSNAQDVHRCDLCETAIIHSYCDFCHVSLCKPCIGEHITDGYDKHKIVPFQQRKSTLIYPKCGKHPHKNCKFECKNCENSLVCSSCMASEQHGGHRFADVSEIYYKTKKEAIKKDTEELGNIVSPTYEEIALDLENQLADLDGGYGKITIQISKQGEEWHREIDNTIKNMEIEINEIKIIHRDILQKHLDEIRQIQSLIKQTLQALNDIQESTEVSPAIKYISKVQEFSKLPPKVKISLPTFIPKPIESEMLHSLFGQITPLSTATEENVSSPNQHKIAVRKLPAKPELVATIQTGHKKLRSITCLTGHRIWTSGETDNIHCFTIYGSALRTTKTKSGKRPYDIAIDSAGDLLYADETIMTVSKVKSGRIEDVIRLQGWKMNKMCVTSIGDLLVTMYSDDYTQAKVVRYAGYTEKQTIQLDDKGIPLYSCNDMIKYITENKNHDICVADCEAGAVVVVNRAGKLRWRYTGNHSATKKELFEPYGITTDSRSCIILADRNNHCIHIVDQNGKFIRYINNCELKYPFGLCVDNYDNLFVGEHYKGTVKKIKYLK